MLGVAKVHEFEGVVRVKDDVLKLQVAMEHAVLVHVVNAIYHLE